MTHKEALERVNEIERAADDDVEVAHSLEDKLYEDALQDIASGEYEGTDKLAQIVLLSKRIRFTRHCA